jgi:hypothetical protein
MAHPQHTPTPASLEEAITVLFCLVDDTLLMQAAEGATSRHTYGGIRCDHATTWHQHDGKSSPIFR